MTVKIQSDRLLENLSTAIDETTQAARGSDIDVLIGEISEIHFENLSEEYANDRSDKAQFKKIKLILMVTSVALAVSAVAVSVVSIFFSAGTLSAGALALAAVSGMVSVTTSFKQLDDTIEKFISYYYSEQKKNSRFQKLKKKITNVSKLINKRVSDLQHINGELKTSRVNEILTQIASVNDFIKQIKENVPKKIMKFDVLDPSPLLNHLG